MRVLSFDSGAKRAGWAVLESGPKYIASGVIEHDRGATKYQEYAMHLTEQWVIHTSEFIREYSPDQIVTEIVPAYGMNDYGQGYLVNVMATTVHAIALGMGVEVSHVSAVKVQNAIAIPGRPKKLTKVQVRNGVVSLLPELIERVPDWTKVMEEPDALAVGLWFLGLTVTK